MLGRCVAGSRFLDRSTTLDSRFHVLDNLAFAPVASAFAAEPKKIDYLDDRSVPHRLDDRLDRAIKIAGPSPGLINLSSQMSFVAGEGRKRSNILFL